MALDQALLELFPAGGQPILRLYEWAPACLSLGYFQKPAEVADVEFVRARGLDLVRRPTGGGAILHHHELTLSLLLPKEHPALKGELSDSYLALERPLLAVLRGLGARVSFRGGGVAERSAANCFAGAACPDIVFEGRKLFGSAQRRKGNAVLLHGSLLLDIDRPLWQGVFKERLGEGFACLSEALPGGPGFAALRDEVATAYAAFLGLSLRPDDLSEPERERMRDLESRFRL